MAASFTYIRIYLVRTILLIGALSALIGYYIVSPEADAVYTQINTWNMNIGTFTLFVGLITIFSRYGSNIMKRGKYWAYQLYALVLMIVFIILGTAAGLYSDLYQTAFFSTKITLHVAILGQMIFFMISGAYRVFRIKTLRTGLFALSALVIALCNAPWILSPFPQATDLVFWLLDNPAMAGRRAMVITGGIGGIVLGIRVLLGLEKGALRATE